jgi:glycine/D-amino acid oxidase-like deaminating enzyme
VSERLELIELGGGIIGLSTAMLLTSRNYNVTVFERDAVPLPSSPASHKFIPPFPDLG